MKLIFFPVFFSFLIVVSPCLSDRQNDLEQNIPGVIDVITFDDYDNWKPASDAFGDHRQNDWSLNGGSYSGPTKNGGKDTNWDSYSVWSDNVPASYQNIIQNWGGKCAYGKCFTTSYNIKKTNIQTYKYSNQVGPYWMYYYFGDGNPHNYKEVYVFMRVFWPKNRWPTQTVANNNTLDFDSSAGGNPVVKHVDGHNYAYIESEKWFGILGSRLNSRDYIDLQTGQVLKNFYSYRHQVNDIERWVHVKNLNNPSKQMTFKLEVFHHDTAVHGSGYQTKRGNVNIAPYFDKVVGVEFHYKIESEINAGDALFEAWIYDENGNSREVLSSKGMKLDLLHDSQKDSNGLAGLNMLYMVSNCRAKGTNNGGYYECGEGMLCNIWYDDIVIGQKRIGPTYYNLLGSGSKSGTSSAANNETSQIISVPPSPKNIRFMD